MSGPAIGKARLPTVDSVLIKVKKAVLSC